MKVDIQTGDSFFSAHTLAGAKYPRVLPTPVPASAMTIFGAPTFYVNNKVFWGQDRLEFALTESLK